MNLLCLRWVIWAMNLNSHDILFSIFNTLCLLGNDPLTDEENNHDINSVAGVLKLYFRGLENPLFPKERFSDLISCISKCLISLVFNFLLTCSCKSVIDSQCELTVLWTVVVRSHIKRSQSFAPNSGTVTFFTERQDVQRLKLTLTALRTLHYCTVCVPPWYDTLGLQLVLQLAWIQLCVSLKEFRKRALSWSEMRLHCTEWMNVVWHHDAQSFLLGYWDVCDPQLGIRSSYQRTVDGWFNISNKNMTIQ